MSAYQSGVVYTTKIWSNPVVEVSAVVVEYWTTIENILFFMNSFQMNMFIY